ncbi:unnamed protein product [Brassica napus]|uniref:(rape) hypothetical protein n=1 Tax=Brassica napus TaxID=3708 RepID=A0A816RAL1_BRANA|nr:unnamed protein product [Brassica napus]
MEPVPFYHTSSNVSVADKESFSKGLGELLDSLGSKIVDAYDTSAGVKGIVYALAQCIPDLSKSDCRICLSQIFAGVPTCCDGQSVNGSKTLVFAVIPIVAIVLVVISLFIYLMRRKKNLKEEAENEQMHPKISDFGMARQFDFDKTRAITRRVVGTYGYMAPEYAMHGRFSVKTDVYSFGVLVFEIITGKRNSGLGFSEGTDLPTFAWKNWVEERLMDLIDHIGHNVIIENCCLLCGQVGIAVKNIFRRFGYYEPLGGRDAVRDHVSIVSMVLRGFHRFKEKRFLVWLCSRKPLFVVWLEQEET